MTEKALKYKMPGEDKHLQLSNQALKYESATITFLTPSMKKKIKEKLVLYMEEAILKN